MTAGPPLEYPLVSADLLLDLRGTLGRLHVAVGMIPTAIAWIGSEGDIQWCNAAFDQLAAREHIALLGRALADVLPLAQEGRLLPPEEHPARRILHTPQPVLGRYECRTTDPPRHVQMTANPLRLGTAPAAAVFSFEDVTERTTAEAQREQDRLALAREDRLLKSVLEDLRESQNHLRQEHAALQAAQNRLVQQEKLAAVGRLANGIAHEVRNPLAILQEGIRCLEREGGLAGSPAKVLGAMQEAVLRATHIIQGVLDFSRPATRDRTLTTLDVLVQEALELVAQQAGLQGIRVTTTFETLPPIAVDLEQLRRVFINLLLNAAQAMPQGGDLAVRGYTKVMAAGEPGIGVRVGDPFAPGQVALLCEIRDTGHGIAREALPKIFEPFFTTKPPGQGTGLGLALVQGIIEAHRGTVTIESVEGRGTTVTVALPTAPGDP